MKRIITKVFSVVLTVAMLLTVPTVGILAGDMGKANLVTTVVASNSRFVPQVATINNDGELWISGADVSTIVDENFDYDQCHNTAFHYMDDVVNIAAGYSYTGAITSDGSLWMWGSNIYGELGNSTNQFGEMDAPIMTDVMDISFGQFHSVALKTDGTVWTWGANYGAQLGNGTVSGDYDRNPTPSQILDDVTAIAAGDHFGAAIKTDGSLWMWGMNDCGQLGTGNTTMVSTPVCVLESSVAAVSCGDAHTMIIKDDGVMWAWGDNYYGQLGDGTNELRSSPVEIMQDVAVISAGNWMSAAVDTDGNLYTWGRNSWGQLGNGGGDNMNTPVFITDDVATVSCGGGYIAILKNDGTLYTSGVNRYGQLGLGHESNASTPTLSRDNVRIPTSTSSEEPLMGDVNGDGVLNTGDASFLLRVIIELEELAPENTEKADVNGDGRINTGDAATILLIVLEQA